MLVTSGANNGPIAGGNPPQGAAEDGRQRLRGRAGQASEPKQRLGVFSPQANDFLIRANQRHFGARNQSIN